MFEGFNLTTDCDFAGYEEIGDAVLTANQREVKKTLDEFLLNDGSINGEDLQENTPILSDACRKGGE